MNTSAAPFSAKFLQRAEALKTRTDCIIHISRNWRCRSSPGNRLKNLRPSKAVLLVNIKQLLTLRSSCSGPRRGKELGELGIIQDAAVLCYGGKIVAVGKTKDAVRDAWIKK